MAKTIAINPSLSLTEESGVQSVYQKVGGICFAIAVLALIAALSGVTKDHSLLFMSIIIGMFFLGGISYALPYYQGPAGIRNNGIMFKSMTNRGTIAWILGITLTGFYIIIYWYPWMFEGLIRIFDPFSKLLTNQPANQWFMYGTFYTLAVLTMGIRFIGRNRNNRYQVIRTLSVMFFQTGFAFLIPMILKKLNEPEYYFSYFWPLKYGYLFPSDVSSLMKSGHLGVFMVFWGAIMTFIATPILTYKYGKRWYCSWVCGCGGLAETAGDPFRQHSDKNLKA